MTKIYENCLSLVNYCVYCAREIYQWIPRTKDIQHSNKNDNEPPTGNAHNNTPQGNRIYAHEARNKYEKNNAS